MDNTTCCSYRRRMKKIKCAAEVLTLVLRLMLIILQIWTIFSG